MPSRGNRRCRADRPPVNVPPVAGGELDRPGTTLQRLLHAWVSPLATVWDRRRCKCRALRSVMDRRGVAWCEANRDRLRDAIHRSARRARVRFPFMSQAIGLALDQALWRTRRRLEESAR